jgi:hypothetical protein
VIVFVFLVRFCGYFIGSVLLTAENAKESEKNLPVESLRPLHSLL